MGWAREQHANTHRNIEHQSRAIPQYKLPLARGTVTLSFGVLKPKRYGGAGSYPSIGKLCLTVKRGDATTHPSVLSGHYYLTRVLNIYYYFGLILSLLTFCLVCLFSLLNPAHIITPSGRVDWASLDLFPCYWRDFLSPGSLCVHITVDKGQEQDVSCHVAQYR